MIRKPLLSITKSTSCEITSEQRWTTGQPASQQVSSGRTLGIDLKALSDCNSAAKSPVKAHVSPSLPLQSRRSKFHIITVSSPATSPVGPDPLPASCKQEELVRSRVCSSWHILDLIARSMRLMQTVEWDVRHTLKAPELVALRGFQCPGWSRPKALLPACEVRF